MHLLQLSTNKRKNTQYINGIKKGKSSCKYMYICTLDISGHDTCNILSSNVLRWLLIRYSRCLLPAQTDQLISDTILEDNILAGHGEILEYDAMQCNMLWEFTRVITRSWERTLSLTIFICRAILTLMWHSFDVDTENTWQFQFLHCRVLPFYLFPKNMIVQWNDMYYCGGT